MRRYLFWICGALLVLLALGCGGNSSGISSATHWTIGTAGGTFQTPNNEVRLAVPASAVTSNTTVTVKKLSTAPTAPSGTVYVPGSGWSFTHVTFSSSATLTMTFAATTPTASLKFYRLADGSSDWMPVETTVDAEAHTATAQINGFSSYALFYAEGTGWNWTSAGGTFLFETLTVTVPADAVTTNVEVQPRRTPAPFTPPAGWTPVAGATFDLGSTNPSLSTATPFTVSIVYDPGTIPPTSRAGAKVFYKENESSDWTALTSTSAPADLKVSANSSTLGTFAVFYPTVIDTAVYWVEQRNAGNDIFLDIYNAMVGGAESLVSSPTQMHGTSQLRTNTFRWSDKSFLGLDFASATETYLMSYSVDTNTSTRHFLIPHDEGFIFSTIEMVRANRIEGADDYVLEVQQRNPVTAAARDSLLLYRHGATEPQVLMTRNRTDSDPPTIMRPWDVSSDGRALVLTSDGLVLFSGTSQTLLADADLGPGEAFFSPSGTKVLFVQHTGAAAGWKVMKIFNRDVISVPGATNGTLVRWGVDDTRVVTAVPSGPDRVITQIELPTSASTVITTAGSHSSSFINDLGVR